MMASINYLESMYSFVDIAPSMAQVLYKVEAGHQQRSLKRGDNEVNLVRTAIQSSATTLCPHTSHIELIVVNAWIVQLNRI